VSVFSARGDRATIAGDGARAHAAGMPTLRAWLSARPFTLAMSSGFFGFFAHAGFLWVLEEEGLLPARVCGSSAGALVAGLWAAGLPARRICDELLTLRREHFWDVGVGPGLLRGELFRRRLEAVVSARTFEECRVPLAVSAFDVGARRTSVLSSGPLVPAVHASCALPGLFHPVRLDGRLFLDGGILDRPGLASVAEGERVLFHHLATPPPWPIPAGAARRPPRRRGMEVVAIEGLPRLGPFRLALGRAAIEGAAAGLRAALGREVAEPA
jgi:NTE family protein